MKKLLALMLGVSVSILGMHPVFAQKDMNDTKYEENAEHDVLREFGLGEVKVKIKKPETK